MVNRPLWSMATVAGVSLVGILTAPPEHRATWWMVVIGAAFTASIVGRRRYPPAQVEGSVLIIAALGLLLAGTTLGHPWTMTALGSDTSMAKGFVHLAGFVVLGSSFFRLTRARTPDGDTESKIDAGLVAIAVGAFVFDLLSTAARNDPSGGVREQISAVMVPLVLAPVAAAGMRLLITGAHRFPSAWMFALASMSALVGTVANLASPGDVEPALAEVGWWCAVTLAGCGCLHPSVGKLSERVMRRGANLSLGRLAVIGCALVALPVMTLRTSSGAVVPAIAATLCVVLVLWRMVRLLREREAVSDELGRRAHRETALSAIGHLAITAPDPASFLREVVREVEGGLSARCHVSYDAAAATASDAYRFSLGPDRGELIVQRSDGAPLTDEERRFASTAGDLAAGALARWHAESLLRHRSLHDPLTDLPNRDLLYEVLGRTLADLEPSRPLAVLFVDLDRFKDINDEFGHTAGDDLLVAVAERLRSRVRPADTVARFAGDEFVVVCPDADADAATRLGQRLLAELQLPVQLGTATVHIDASIGIAAATTDDPVEAVLHRADVAMYRAKADGRGRIVLDDGTVANALTDPGFTSARRGHRTADVAPR